MQKCNVCRISNLNGKYSFLSKVVNRGKRYSANILKALNTKHFHKYKKVLQSFHKSSLCGFKRDENI